MVSDLQLGATLSGFYPSLQEKVIPIFRGECEQLNFDIDETPTSDKIMIMIKLQEKFVSGEGGFSSDPLTYTQVARTENTAIYERSRNGKVKDYEVFRIKILPKGTQVFQTVTEDDEEKYPSTSQFGISAWSYQNKRAALFCYEELNKEAAKNDTPENATSSVIIPDVEFTVGEFADKNSLSYANAFVFIKSAVADGSVKFVREERRNVKGKPSKIYAKAA